MFALNQTLNFQEKLRVGKAHLAYSTDDLIDHYNCGDLNSVLFSTQSTRLPSMSSNSSLRQLELKTTQEIDQYFRTELIFKRNERMAKRVIELLNKYPERNFFFAFGAGKLIYCLVFYQLMDDILNVFNLKISKIDERRFDIVGCHCQVNV